MRRPWPSSLCLWRIRSGAGSAGIRAALTPRADSLGPAPPARGPLGLLIESALALKSRPRHDGGGVGSTLAAPQTGQPGGLPRGVLFWVHLSSSSGSVPLSLAVPFGLSVSALCVAQPFLSQPCLCVSMNLPVSLSLSLSPCLPCHLSAFVSLFHASRSSFFLCIPAYV